MIVQELTQRLRSIAMKDKEGLPQYVGYFENWILAESVRNISYKGGSILADGRWVLANPQLTSWYDPDNGHLCAVDNGTLFQVVQGYPA